MHVTVWWFFPLCGGLGFCVGYVGFLIRGAAADARTRLRLLPAAVVPGVIAVVLLGVVWWAFEREEALGVTVVSIVTGVFGAEIAPSIGKKTSRERRVRQMEKAGAAPSLATKAAREDVEIRMAQSEHRRRPRHPAVIVAVIAAATVLAVAVVFRPVRGAYEFHTMSWQFSGRTEQKLYRLNRRTGRVDLVTTSHPTNKTINNPTK